MQRRNSESLQQQRNALKERMHQDNEEDKAQLEGLLENQKDINELYQELSYEELTDVLNQWLNPEASDDEEKSSDTSVSAVVAESAKVEDASAAFDELFNK